ncbi:MAG: hypothetical protein HC918_06270 [Oscillatoriales cyanobacterium SM2_1_8]|nr:hypothetical protein [Oscillatoriales cyanobacterium SM2_1_8]
MIAAAEPVEEFGEALGDLAAETETISEVEFEAEEVAETSDLDALADFGDVFGEESATIADFDMDAKIDAKSHPEAVHGSIEGSSILLENLENADLAPQEAGILSENPTTEDFLSGLGDLFGEAPAIESEGFTEESALAGLDFTAEIDNHNPGVPMATSPETTESNEEDLGLGELFDGLSDADLVAIAGSPEVDAEPQLSGIEDLESFLGAAEEEEGSPTLDVLSDYFDGEFGSEDGAAVSRDPEGVDVDNLEALITGSANGHGQGSATDFDGLESLLAEGNSTASGAEAGRMGVAAAPADDFADLSSIVDSTIGRSSAPGRTAANNDGKKAAQRSTAMKVKVDVRYLDGLNNLVGELVVNRNLLASDSERLQQFIVNLLSQVQLLSEVSQKMRDTFDRSVLETSVIANRPKGFSGFQQMLVMDRDRPGMVDTSNDPHDIRSRFTGDTFDTYNEYHILSQEIIELIVKIKESTSDIEFVVSETEQVTRQLGTITTQVQDNLKQLRMLPFSQLTDRLPRGVRDRALQAHKKADIAFEGVETLVDKAILEQLQDPMVHLVNNAIDHGIEDPETRRQRASRKWGN